MQAIRAAHELTGGDPTRANDGPHSRAAILLKEARFRRIMTLLGTVLFLLVGPQAVANASSIKISLDRNFGTQAVGTTISHTVTIANAGITTVRFGSIGVSSNDGAFGLRFESNTCFSPDASLDPGESCSFDITFTPLSTGTQEGTTDIAVGNSSTILKLRGRGV
jgi:hypothetical protein